MTHDLDLYRRVFTEWDRRFREEPRRYLSELQRVLTKTPEEYGDSAAPYFAWLCDEIGSTPPTSILRVEGALTSEQADDIRQRVAREVQP